MSDMPALSAATKQRAALTTYGHSAAYSVLLGLVLILVPFYILELGYNPAWLGLIISAQGVFQLGLRLFGGVLSDRIGEQWVIAASFAAMAVGATILALSSALPALIGAQLLLGGSRAVYWTSAQAYGSRIHDTGAGKFMGRFFGFSSVGQLGGSFAGGWMAQTVDFSIGFGISAGLSVVLLLSVLGMPHLPRRASRSVKQILAPVPGVFRSRAMALPAIAAFGTSLGMALVGSLLPAYMKDVGYSEGIIGTLRSVHGLGAIGIGFAFSWVLTRMGQQRMFAAIALGNGGFLVLLVLTSDIAWVAGLVMLWMGVAFNAGRVIYAAMTAEASRPDERGVAMAVVGLYWAAAQLVGPVVFGVVATATTLGTSLVIAGLLLLTPGVLTPVLYALLGPRPVEAAGENRA